MGMNVLHRLCCSSNYWAKAVERKLLPWALRDVELGERTLEIGPGCGANLPVLADKTPSLTCLEIDGPMADRLRDRYGSRAHIITGDGTATGLPEAQSSSVVCFTMLHHVPTPPLQDRLFSEAFRVVGPECTTLRQISATAAPRSRARLDANSWIASEIVLAIFIVLGVRNLLA